MFMPVSVVTLLPTLVRWTLHDTEPCPSEVIVYIYMCYDVWCFFVSLEIVLLKQGKIKILQKGT